MRRPAIRPALPEDVGAMLPHIRAADVAELWAGWRVTPQQCMERGMAACQALTGTIDDAPVCMFGVVPVNLLCGRGCIWMIGTTLLEQYQFTFLKGSRDFVAGMKREYRELGNIVDARNTLAIRWLQWLGFTVGPAFQFGPDLALFRPFIWRAADV